MDRNPPKTRDLDGIKLFPTTARLAAAVRRALSVYAPNTGDPPHRKVSDEADPYAADDNNEPPWFKMAEDEERVYHVDPLFFARN